MINVHPQRWNDHGFHWYKELVGQNVKNVIKRVLVKKKEFRSQNIEDKRMTGFRRKNNKDRHKF